MLTEITGPFVEAHETLYKSSPHLNVSVLMTSDHHITTRFSKSKGCLIASSLQSGRKGLDHSSQTCSLFCLQASITSYVQAGGRLTHTNLSQVDVGQLVRETNEIQNIFTLH